MSVRTSRRAFLVTGITTLVIAAAAWAGVHNVDWLTAPGEVTAGQSMMVQVGVSEPMGVHLTSNPPGLVNQTVTVTGNSGAFVVATNPGAPVGSYLLVATPVGGGGSRVRPVLVGDPE